jgi:soluble lytic murein transglycosylase-like protein
MNRKVLIGLAILFLVVLMSKKISDANKVAVMDIKQHFRDYVRYVAARYGVPSSRVEAIIMQESKGNPQAKGITGDWGLMQITAPALADVNKKFQFGFSLEDMLDPYKNIQTGTAFLSMLLSQLHNLNDATQAYNVGAAAFLADNTKGQGYLWNVLEWEKYFLT